MSDFVSGVKDTVKGANGGLDVEMPDGVWFSVKKMKAAIEKGSVKEETIDKAAVRIVRTLLAFQQARDPQEHSPKRTSNILPILGTVPRKKTWSR
jgi:beta-glucosidase